MSVLERTLERRLERSFHAKSSVVFNPSLTNLSDFQGNTLEANVRNSTATAFDYLGVLKTIPINSHRLNYGRWDGTNWFDDDGAGNTLHPSHTFKGTKRYRSFMPYATAKVVAAGGHRFEGGRYYQTIIGGTTDTDEPLQLSNDGNMLITGTSVKKVSGGTAWNAAVSSNNNFTGSAYCEATIVSTASFIMMGLNIDPKTAQDFLSIDYAIYLRTAGVLQVYESGALLGAFGTYSVGDKVSVWYEGTTLHYQLNGVDFHTTTVSAGLTLALDTSFFLVNSQLDNIIFTQTKIRPIASDIGITDWVDKGIYNDGFGVLVEGGSTNTLSHSEDFVNAAWNKADVTAALAPSIIAPFGASHIIMDTATTAQHAIHMSGLAVGNATRGALVKYNGRHLQMRGGTNINDYVNFDLLNGIIAVQGPGIINAGMIPYGNGWYYCWMYVLEFNVVFFNNIDSLANNWLTTYAGNVTKGIYIAAVQKEGNVFPSSYIPTTPSSSSRANEMGSIKWNSSFFPQAAGTLGLTIKPQFASGDLVAGNRLIVGLFNNVASLLRLRATGVTVLAVTDGFGTLSSTASAWLHTDALDIFVRWGLGADSANPAQQRLVITARNASKGESFVSVSSAYDGAFTDTGFYQLLASGGLNNTTFLNNSIWDKVLTDADINSLVEL